MVRGSDWLEAGPFPPAQAGRCVRLCQQLITCFNMWLWHHCHQLLTKAFRRNFGGHEQRQQMQKNRDLKSIKCPKTTHMDSCWSDGQMVGTRSVTLALLCPYIICHTRGSNSQPHYDNSHYQRLHSLSYATPCSSHVFLMTVTRSREQASAHSE